VLNLLDHGFNVQHNQEKWQSTTKNDPAECIRFSASERSDDDKHLPTTINSRATIVNVLLDHMH
jgi:hypothetical protein